MEGRRWRGGDGGEEIDGGGRWRGGDGGEDASSQLTYAK